ncbi:patatin-like phospholipase family protein [Chthoniobacter flavus]|uniref:patatin-like phospholipase family protein n=1 Tax=Chthoniobacter flavus TaxID=191863 RepID=UPI00138B1A4C|nr:patatin-like phospholipase family protein [Chthoniobacter flavus]
MNPSPHLRKTKSGRPQDLRPIDEPVTPGICIAGAWRASLAGTSALVLALTFLLHSPACAAEETSSERRPKIGLVLSGGAAFGLAHVGVLKALEELHIPVDYIAGTSMGSVVGGLYASGRSPEEIDDWLRHADWDFLLSDSIPRESESFRTKQREFDVNQGIAFKVSRKGLTLPAGLIHGRNVMASLRELTVPVREIRDFAKLPIPFRAVATDIETGNKVVLRDGDLVESMRASLSVPALFTPQVIRGARLVDGGITDNLPIDVVKEMGADVVIAVESIDQLKKSSDLETATSIANQVLTIFVQKQMQEQIARLGPDDVLLRIKIEDLGAADFKKAPQVIDAGYQQTLQNRARLAHLSVGEDAFQQYLARQRVPRGKPVMVSFLNVKTPQGEFHHALSKPMEFDVKSMHPFVRLQSLIGDLGEMQKFEVGDYQVIQRGDQYGLVVKAQQKKTGTSYLNFGFDLAYSSNDDTDFALLLAYRMTELNSLGGEWNSYLSIGETTRVQTEWYQPIDWQRRLFFAAHALFDSDYILGRTGEGDPLRFRQQDEFAGLDLGARLWQAGELRIGYDRGVGRIMEKLGPAKLPSSFDRGWVHADLIIDNLDSESFARHGIYASSSVMASRRELGASDNYTRFEGQMFAPITFGKNTIVPRVSASLKLGGEHVPIYDQVPLGGFLNLSGFRRGSLFDDNAALAELVYYRKLADLGPGVARSLYGGFSLEAGEVWGGHFRLEDATFAGSVFLGADTFLGPLFLGVGVSEGGNAAAYLQLAPLFRTGRNQIRPAP